MVPEGEDVGEGNKGSVGSRGSEGRGVGAPVLRQQDARGEMLRSQMERRMGRPQVQLSTALERSQKRRQGAALQKRELKKPGGTWCTQPIHEVISN